MYALSSWTVENEQLSRRRFREHLKDSCTAQVCFWMDCWCNDAVLQRGFMSWTWCSSSLLKWEVELDVINYDLFLFYSHGKQHWIFLGKYCLSYAVMEIYISQFLWNPFDVLNLLTLLLILNRRSHPLWKCFWTPSIGRTNPHMERGWGLFYSVFLSFIAIQLNRR